MIVLQSLVFTIIGPDRPGVVEQISRCVNDQACNWLGSRMSRLGGKFAGIIHVEGDAGQLELLKSDLDKLSDLTVVVEKGDSDGQPAQKTIVVTMLGLDRPGIVREVSGELVARQLNVLDLETDISRAAMTGDPMFHGRAVVACGGGEDLVALSERLDEISHNLGVDIEIEET
jgi:glycine cleavage system regulatory protein